MCSVETLSRSSSAVVRYQCSATCNSLEGSHNRPITNIPITSDHDTFSCLGGKSSLNNSSSPSARHNNHPSHTEPKLRQRSRLISSSLTASAFAGSPPSNNCLCSSSRPLILRASALARARPSPSSSPSWATVSCTTLPPCLTERTNCQ